MHGDGVGVKNSDRCVLDCSLQYLLRCYVLQKRLHSGEDVWNVARMVEDLLYCRCCTLVSTSD